MIQQIKSYNQLLYLLKIGSSKYFKKLIPFTFLDLEKEFGFDRPRGDTRKLFHILRDYSAFYEYNKVRFIVEYKIDKTKFKEFYYSQVLFNENIDFLSVIKVVL